MDDLGLKLVIFIMIFSLLSQAIIISLMWNKIRFEREQFREISSSHRKVKASMIAIVMTLQSQLDTQKLTEHDLQLSSEINTGRWSELEL